MLTVRPNRAHMALVGALALSAAAVSPARAWGPHAHRIATRIAEERLTPEARAGVRALLRQGDTLVDIANWADHEGHDAVLGSAPWHYVNVPITSARYQPADCPAGACVVEKIKHFRGVLANRRAPKADRARALLFLVHFVEDVHQPLHVGDNGDRGGNLTQIQFRGEGTNLHRLWDSDIVNAVSRDERQWARRIEPLLSPDNVRAWSRGTVEDWTNESLQDAKAAYHFPAGAKDPLPSGTSLENDYVAFAQPVIERRLAQAGVRLANELNALFR
ncbi:MAG: S1/P1 nuclease [Isosphaeraceae bacterium]|nr:S1/P1 nuclease [Isosphaeraceae bacterium]